MPMGKGCIIRCFGADLLKKVMWARNLQKPGQEINRMRLSDQGRGDISGFHLR